jgi:hypothetical protein
MSGGVLSHHCLGQKSDRLSGVMKFTVTRTEEMWTPKANGKLAAKLYSKRLRTTCCRNWVLAVQNCTLLILFTLKAIRNNECCLHLRANRSGKCFDWSPMWRHPESYHAPKYIRGPELQGTQFSFQVSSNPEGVYRDPSNRSVFVLALGWAQSIGACLEPDAEMHRQATTEKGDIARLKRSHPPHA